ncbi:type II toxin-antitoxin system Phd/YefM family antitoxin [Nocardioides sp. AE5]|uniref:type II toxin-antitoxin system Phd/YefM family antitoxin n=1 Tax=Nocardioides sp. AE5 TaxID=2962573 RepID=UPI002881FA4D|nr:type II toxin-antitoxin system Phd/YefM family antitoxin [Nocardioides sp. AE5]MDT0200834.1 hypothetical protein [Nocardioides sp. AE5]
MSVVNARTVNQSPSKVKTLAADRPVFITDRERPTLVVLSIDHYEHLTGTGSVRESLRMDEEIDFAPVVSGQLGRVAGL